MEKYRAQPKMTHKVVVRDPSAKDDAWLDSYADEASAHAAFDALPEWLRTSGRARVTTVP